MKDPKYTMALFYIAIPIFVILFWSPLPVFGQNKSVTERECALTEGAKIIWDLRVYRWICCIPKGEYLDDCVPISDMAPLPKTSTKPLPEKGSGGVIKIQEPQNQTE